MRHPRVVLGGNGGTHNFSSEVSPEKTPWGSDVSWLLSMYLRGGKKIEGGSGIEPRARPQVQRWTVEKTQESRIVYIRDMKPTREARRRRGHSQSLQRGEPREDTLGKRRQLVVVKTPARRHE